MKHFNILQIPGKCHLITRHGIFLSRNEKIFRSCDNGLTWEQIAKVPICLIDRVKSLCSLSARMFRSGIYHIYLTNNSNLIVFGFGHIWKFSTKNNKWALDSSPVPISGSRPLYISGNKDLIVYGEYCSNPDRKPIKIWASKDEGKTWEPVYSFQKIRHIHGIFWDEYSENFWITTGDHNKESGIWRTDHQFGTVEKVFAGSQLARTIELIFSDNYIYFGTDTPREQNYICRIKRSGKDFERLKKVGSSVFHACKTANFLFFSTACEPSHTNETRFAVIWGGYPDTDQWIDIARYPKDRWPMKLFQYGQIFFPAGKNDTNFLWYTPFATLNDQITFRMDISSIFK